MIYFKNKLKKGCEINKGRVSLEHQTNINLKK